ncbi:507491ea-c415-4eb3-ac13-811aa8d7f337 [Sclerotinia trifoliorum]|uniref:507491ea-c415-4eb3-ac13-811aa8d7f337 n=1 Tax=Sclerotinia trifoliorum TaxID=28548 RepID=A0A8H2VWA3_9HELO|nr:507491ea-c415-4eb3-ac13-811aa8d7f337 [Sclerotinia trifoliorum]
MFINTTCNATLDDMRIGKSEVVLVGNLTFHELGIFVSSATALIAILLSLYLMWMHALHYTKPYEQRHIIRILFMVPIYSVASFLSFWQYWHEIYYSVISECYEAFAIASFFALLCHYIAPDLHHQKIYFRTAVPKPWVWPITWMKRFCGGDKGPWRTPRSGLTWFNIIWAGVYQYCFIRVTMTVLAVVTQYFGKYCDSSDSPVFAHIWILVIEGAAVTIAMYCLIQFYIQLRTDLAPHKPFLKVVAIKAVIFLSFWQSFAISILMSSTIGIVKPTKYLAYPDLKIGIPNLLLCIEMAIFSILHLFAFPWRPYASDATPVRYPSSPGGGLEPIGPKQGGPLGLLAFADAMNPWDLVKAFARSMRWLFVGVKTREADSSYKPATFNNDNDMSLQSGNSEPDTSYKGRDAGLPIANDYGSNNFSSSKGVMEGEEGIGLIDNAQPDPTNLNHSGYIPAAQRYTPEGQDINTNGARYNYNPDRLVVNNPTPTSMQRQEYPAGMAVIAEPKAYLTQVAQPPYAARPSSPYGVRQLSQPEVFLEEKRAKRAAERAARDRADQGAHEQSAAPSELWSNSIGPMQPNEPPSHIHNALWGSQAQPQRREDDY